MSHTVELNLKIDGMHCDACVGRVTAALNQVSGVQVENVEVGSARIRYAPEAVSPEAILSAVNQIGFRATPAPVISH